MGIEEQGEVISLLQDIPDEVTLHWVAKYLGIPIAQIYKMRNAGKGPHCTKRNGRYVVTKQSLLLWLSTFGGNAHPTNGGEDWN